MVSYVNDLRLSELATGEGSGTWGTTTNTNLELIGEALGYATEQSFGSDADATTTVGDGVSDPARAMYFKVTSAVSLTATRTLTIAPNTVSRVMFIENATSGSQSIAISQGSGANVTIATGKTAIVYLDGAGSGAAVVDAMAGVDPGVTDTLAEVLTAGNATGGTDIAVGTGDDITFADSSKAIFGAGSDLQIYHDGSNSYISDQGTGNLRIIAEDFRVVNSANSETMIQANVDGDVRLYHDAAQKLATTSTGIDVTGDITLGDANPTITFNDSSITNLSHTISSASDNLRIMADVNGVDAGSRVEIFDGTTQVARFEAGAVNVTGSVTADGLTVDGTASVSATNPKIQLFETDTTDLNTQIQNQAGDFRVSRLDDDAGSLTIHFSIDHSTGNVSIPSGDLDVTGTVTADGAEIDVTRSNTAGSGFLTLDLIGTSGDFAHRVDTSNAYYLDYYTGSAWRPTVKIEGQTGDISFYNSSGTSQSLFWDASAESLGIGTSSPNATLKVQGPVDTATLSTSSTPAARINNGGAISNWIGANGYNYGYIQSIQDDGTNNLKPLALQPLGGSVGIGCTPSRNLDIQGTGDTLVSIVSPAANQAALFFGDTDSDSVGRVAYDNSDNSMRFNTNASERMRIDSSGNVGIGGTTTTGWANKQLVLDAGSNTSAAFVMVNDTTGRAATDGSVITLSGSDMYLIQRESANMIFRTANTERMRIDSSGQVGIGTDSPDRPLDITDTTADGSGGAVIHSYLPTLELDDISGGGTSFILQHDATNTLFKHDSTERMRIDASGTLLVGTTSAINSAKMSVNGNVSTFVIHPAIDNNFDCGHPSYRWDDIRATNGTIQTSDRNEKQDIEALSDAEQRVAVAAKGLMRKFRWISSVEENGDDARIHFGIIAQDLQDAFTAEGLDAGRYAMFISDTWTDEATGEERTRLGVRYSELLAFIIAAI